VVLLLNARQRFQAKKFYYDGKCFALQEKKMGFVYEANIDL
jgi:hypothetical protein